MKESEDRDLNKEESELDFAETISIKAARKLKAKQEKKTVLFGLGMLGMVGWSVAIPTLICLSIGLYVDKYLNSSYSWTITFLVLGIGLGCFNAWYWLNQEINKDN